MNADSLSNSSLSLAAEEREEEASTSPCVPLKKRGRLAGINVSVDRPLSMPLSTTREHQSTTLHAHLDCFSGASGDMLLAACLDASDDAEEMLHQIVSAITRGMPDLEGVFQVLVEKVWRGKGSFVASHVTVKSMYGQQLVPVPSKKSKLGETIIQPHPIIDNSLESHSHDHEHHSHSHHHSHNHEHAADDQGLDTQVTTVRVGDLTHSHLVRQGHQAGPIRNLPEIRRMLQDAPSDCIPDWVRDNAIDAFTQLAQAEAEVHGAENKEAVHFHEVGAVDSIVDTVGTLLALHFLGAKTFSCSPLPIGQGSVYTDHGVIPVPAPAALKLMIGMPTTPGPPGQTGELVTPTGAALVRVLTTSGKYTTGRTPPYFTIHRVGIGAGSKDFREHPNIVRLLLGEVVMGDTRKRKTGV